MGEFMGLLTKQAMKVIIETKDKLGAVAKARVVTMFGKSYHPARYFLSENHNLVYVVNNKCASSSIKKLLLTENNVDLSNIGHYGQIHQKGRELGFDVSNTHTHLDKYYFSFVRNPFDRIRSLYINKFLDSEKIISGVFQYKTYLGGVFRQDDSFEQFLTKVSSIPQNMTDLHFRSQHHLLYNESPKINFIGKLENYQSDMARLAKDFNLNTFKPIEKTNAANKTIYEKFSIEYNLTTYEMVRELYKNDVKSFDYIKEADVLYRKIKG